MKAILIVEDHAAMRELLSCGLKMMGFSVIAAKNGQEALEKATVEKPQLILLDIIMPSMDGWTTARALRRRPETKEIPILAATALFREADLKTCLEAGCTVYLLKPFTFEELKAKVWELLPK